MYEYIGNAFFDILRAPDVFQYRACNRPQQLGILINCVIDTCFIALFNGGNNLRVIHFHPSVTFD